MKLYVREARPQKYKGYKEYSIEVEEIGDVYKVIHNDFTREHVPIMFIHSNSLDGIIVNFCIGIEDIGSKFPTSYYMLSFSKEDLKKNWEEYFNNLVVGFKEIGGI